jgi:hypothetical protein
VPSSLSVWDILSIVGLTTLALGQLVPTHLVPATSKKREGTVRAVERVQKLAAPISRGRLFSVRTSSSGATTPLYGLNQSGVCNELFHRNGTLMQDLRQHAGVTGRREIGAIIAQTIRLGFEYPDVLRAPREGRAAALLRNVMNSRRLIAAPEALDTASSTRTSTLEGPGTTPADVRLSGHLHCNRPCPLYLRMCCKTIFASQTSNIDSRMNASAQY